MKIVCIKKLCFNPTLVRLRRRQAVSAVYIYIGFNPTLVRLRPELARGQKAAAPEFQSHAGSIEA